VKSRFPNIHVLVNNAGGPIRRMDRQINWPDTDWSDDLNLKLMGMLRATQAFLPQLARDGSGRIISISGVAGTSVWVPALTHGLNNSAMNHATKYLAQDLAAEKITINAVEPGLLGTEARDAWAETRPSSKGNRRPNFSASSAGRWESCRDDGRRWTRSPVP
jgi:3-oxoacyl-[acyl-carrier protein] reductase